MLIERFMAKTRAEDGHLLWTGAVNGRGYPSFWVEGRSVLAHRWIWEQTHGSIPEGHQVHHECGERRCVAVAHLEALDRRSHVREHFPEGAPCNRGHERVLRPNGKWVCPICTRAFQLRWRDYREAIIQAILDHQRSENSDIESSPATAEV
jgi:hypothetical protein